MNHFKIDGNRTTGAYRCWCDCGKHWDGQALRFGLVHFDPALPISECCVHWRDSHFYEPIHIGFALGFKQWLYQYAELATAVIDREKESSG